MKASIFATHSEHTGSVVISSLCFNGKVHFTRRVQEAKPSMYSSFRLCDASCIDMNNAADQEIPDGIEKIIRAYMIAKQIT